MPKMSSVDAACEVLKGESKGLRMREITSRILRRGIAALSGKTPAATIRGRIADEAKKPDGRIERTGTGRQGVYSLRKARKS